MPSVRRPRVAATASGGLHEGGYVTVCIASGDTGAQSKTSDGKAHVQYPASDPWVLSVGGTSIGGVSGTSFTEYAWNDATGASGGGVSYFFAKPSYQNAVNVPVSVNPDHHVGRGVPDVAGNASPFSGYSGIYVGGSPQVGNGTSGSSPCSSPARGGSGSCNSTAARWRRR
jgi:kumamolisin